VFTIYNRYKIGIFFGTIKIVFEKLEVVLEIIKIGLKSDRYF